MGRLVNSTYLSLDGVVQHAESWTFDYRTDDAAQYSHELLFGSDALLMGRHTYDIFAGHWPSVTDDTGFADRMNTLPHYVISEALTEPSWANTTVVSRRDAHDAVKQLKDEVGAVLQYGFGPVTTDLLSAGLVDELQFWLHPLLVGATNSADLIAHTTPEARLELSDLRRFASGLLILTYQPAGVPAAS